MGDKKLFRLNGGDTVELKAKTTSLEKPLQTLFEKRLLLELGIRFLASEYVTGGDHPGRIDTLGIDENQRPVIIEYKRGTNDSVLSQILYYCDWLKQNQASFTLLVQQHFPDDAKQIDWSNVRLLCVAGDYSRYDLHAAKQMAPIEMLCYRYYGDDLILLESVYDPNGNSKKKAAAPATGLKSSASGSDDEVTIQDAIDLLSPDARALYDSVRDTLLSLGEDISEVPLKVYVAFKRIKNVACVKPSASAVTVYLRVNPDAVALEPGFTRDMRKINHNGTGDLEVSIRSSVDVERAEPLFRQAYDIA